MPQNNEQRCLLIAITRRVRDMAPRADTHLDSSPVLFPWQLMGTRVAAHTAAGGNQKLLGVLSGICSSYAPLVDNPENRFLVTARQLTTRVWK